jgi:hypothetical protein
MSVKPIIIVAALVFTALCGFPNLADADPVGPSVSQSGHAGIGGSDTKIEAVSPDLLSWDECRTRLDTFNGREPDAQQRVMDYCLGMERGREVMREELRNFPGREIVSTESISMAPLFLPTEMGTLPTAVIGR